jgi:signal transduction histidine kinase
MPDTLDRFGLPFALKEFCERLQVTANVPVLFHGEEEVRYLSRGTQLMIFRVAQELINNAVRHSNASAINVTIVGGDKFELIVEDNGSGFDIDFVRQHSTCRNGLGLFDIENRASVLNATLHIAASKSKGSRITLTMPL